METVKCFLMRTPFNLRDMSIYKIYQECSYREDELSFEILNIVKDKAIHFRKYQAFFNSLCAFLDLTPVDTTIEEIKNELRTLIIWVMEELQNENLYNQFGRLNFNAMWFDHPNCLMFYLMSKNDVESECFSNG